MVRSVFAAFLNRLASCSRLVVMDQRGVGLSDGAGTIPTIDERVADLAAVADAVGSKRMFLIGHCHGGPPAIVYTASRPERVAGLILMSTFANGTAGANHSGALSEQDFASWIEAIDHWGEGRSMSYFNPSRDEGRLYRHLYASFERAALTRGMARAAVASTRRDRCDNGARVDPGADNGDALHGRFPARRIGKIPRDVDTRCALCRA